jgi:1,4-dihydroxy-2-naphthoate polyprenyltransferase
MLKNFFHATRPKTLPAALAPVLMGSAMAFTDGKFHLLSALVAGLGAVLIQIGTNLTNDYADFFKGADVNRKGDVRVTQAGIFSPQQVKTMAAMTFLLAFLVGLYLVYRGGWLILALGIIGILCGIFYTVGKYALAYTGLADIFVLIFFGPIAVGVTHYVQSLEISPEAFIAGLAPGLFSVAILTVNNRRDMEEDALVDKKTLVVRFGRTFGNVYYQICVFIACFTPFLVMLVNPYHPLSILATFTFLLALPIVKILKNQDGRALNPQLGATARLLLVYSLLFSVGWILV